MTKLKLASVQDERPVKLSVSLPAVLHRDLVAYAEIMSRESGKPIEIDRAYVGEIHRQRSGICKGAWRAG
jgi:hypothetical protein